MEIGGITLLQNGAGAKVEEWDGFGCNNCVTFARVGLCKMCQPLHARCFMKELWRLLC